MNGHLQRSINQSAARQNGVICVRPARRGCTDGRTPLPAGWRLRGDREAIALREDSDLDVPEPEVALVLNLFAEIVGLTVRPTPRRKWRAATSARRRAPGQFQDHDVSPRMVDGLRPWADAVDRHGNRVWRDAAASFCADLPAVTAVGGTQLTPAREPGGLALTQLLDGRRTRACCAWGYWSGVVPSACAGSMTICPCRGCSR